MITSCRLLSGLPGTGPVPRYCHGGTPTPWREGVVIEMLCDDGSSFIVNFEADSHLCHRCVRYWSEAPAVFVNADGAGYLVSAVDPERYTFMGTVDTFVFAGKRLVVADRFAVSAYDANLSRVWEREICATNGVHLHRVVGAVVQGSIFDVGCEEPIPLRLNLDTGADLR